MDPLRLEEYRVLRETIRTRGHVRLALCLSGLAAWGLALLAVLAWLPNPIAGTVPLLILVSTFEVTRMLHAESERISRYLLVFFEETTADAANAPRWEHTAGRVGPGVPGAGGHPLLLPIFHLATLINMLSVLLPGPIPLEVAVMTVPHVSFVVWMLYVDRGTRRQRDRDLAQFREQRGAPR